MPNWNALAVSPAGAVMSLDYVAGPHSWLPNGRAFAWLEHWVTLADPADPLFDALLEAELFTGLTFGPDGTLYLATEGAVNQILAISPDKKLLRHWWAPNRDHRNAPAEPIDERHEPSLQHPPGIVSLTPDGTLHYVVFRAPRRLGTHAFAFDYWPAVWRVRPDSAPEHVAGMPESPLAVGMSWREAGLGLVRSLCPQPEGGIVLHVTRPVDAGSPEVARNRAASGMAPTRAGDLPSYEHVVFVSPSGLITAVWGSGEIDQDPIGKPASQASLEGLRAITLSPDGQIVYLNMHSRTCAGLLSVGADGRVRLVEGFDFPHSIAPVLAMDAQGVPYWLETPSVMRYERGRGQTYVPAVTFWAGEGR